MRSHLYLPVVTSTGDIISNVVVRLMNPGTTNNITDTIFAADSGVTAYGPGPFVATGGTIDVYLTYPRRVRIGVTPPSQGEFFIEDVDIVIPSGIPTTGGAQPLYLFSPNGNRWVLSVTDAGVLSAPVLAT